MKPAERLSVDGAGGPCARSPPRVQGGASGHQGLEALAKGGLGSRGLGSGPGRRPGVQRGLQRGHVQQPMARLSRCSCTVPHASQAPTVMCLNAQYSWIPADISVCPSA